jgi:hypothetical protein
MKVSAGGADRSGDHAAVPDAAADVTPADTADFIDVLIGLHRAAEGRQPGRYRQLINLGISETNSAHAASGVQQRDFTREWLTRRSVASPRI